MKFILLAAAGVSIAAAQIGYPPVGYPGGYPPGYPGGYPGGYPPGYPGGGGTGIPAPRRGSGSSKDSKNPNAQALPNFRGKLAQMDSKKIRVELDDHREMEFRATGKTKYFKNGDELKSPKFNTGDQVSVEGFEEADGSMTAVNVYWEKAAASGTTTEKRDDGTPDTWKDASKDAPRAGDDPGPPVLRRSQPQDQASSTPAPAPAPAQSADAAPNAAPLPSAPLPSATERTPPPAPRAADDPGPPTLRRGKPQEKAQEQSSSAPAPAAAQPAPAPNAVPLPTVNVSPAPRQTAANLPPATLSPGDRVEDDQTPLGSHQEDPLIRKSAEAALQFTEGLPNYVCQEMMSRFQSETQPANFRALDVVTMEVLYENGRENYRNIAINNKPTNKSMDELPGARSTGEFGTVLIDLFSPATDADFRPHGSARIAGVTAKVYDFDVKRENSHWTLHFGPQSYEPAFGGTVWIDPQTSRVLRIEMEAKGLPKDFPEDHVESATDYQYVRLGDAQQYLLPVHAETLSCQRGTPYCSRNTIDFRNYHKYSGESSIQFGDVKK